MKKKIILTESELKEIIKDIVLKEQGGLLRKAGQALRKAFRGSADDAVTAAQKGTKAAAGSVAKSASNVVARNAMDHLKRLINNVPQLEQKFSKETVDELAEFLNTSLIEGKTVFRNDAGTAFLYSASGKMVPVEQLQGYLYFAAQEGADLTKLAQTLPRQLSGNPPTVFRDDIIEILSKGQKGKSAQTAGQIAGKTLSQFENKNLLKNCVNNSYCDVQNITNNFMRKLAGSAKLQKFDPSKVKILEKANVAGREVINVALEDGSNVLFYKSSGANVATTGKQAGEWFVIPGFAESGWFFKTKDTVNLTKGSNKYLTEMAQFLQTNGSAMLGK